MRGSGAGSSSAGVGISPPSSGWTKLSVRIFGGVATLALLMSMASFWFALHRETNSPSLVSTFRKELPSSVERGKDSTPTCTTVVSSPTPSDFDVHLGIALDKMDRTALITLVEKAKKEQIHSSSLNLARFVISALEDADEDHNDPDPKHHHHSAEPVAPDQLHSHGNQYGHDHVEHQQQHDVDTAHDQQFQGLDVIAVEESHETIQARYNEIIARYPNHPPSSFPIGLVAANRPTLLNRTLTSLLAVHGINASQVTVYLDGHLPSMLEVIASFKGVNLMTHDNPGVPGEAGDAMCCHGANRIARHYKFTLSHLFDDNPTASYVIIVEDDMLFSPDFLLYFVQTAHLYETDPSIYCISSFNDNGFHERVADNKGMFRTEFFIGLGWLASRKVYKELENRWPSTHWDHWIRSPPQRQNRECIFPEISRNYNIGKVGVHSDDNLFARYFQHIVVNTQPAVDLGDLSRLHKENYENAMLKSLSAAAPVSSLTELNKITPTSHPHGVIIWFQARSDDDRIWEQTIAPLFGIWHTQPNIRGMKDGVSTFLYRKVRVYLVGTFSRYRGQIQPIAPAWDASAFIEPARPRHEVHVIVASQAESCDSACQSHQLQCHKPSLVLLNTCDELEKAFQCSKCDFNQGSDQPAYVSNPKKDEYQMCFRNGGHYDYSCTASHPDTQRLCACVDA